MRTHPLLCALLGILVSSGARADLTGTGSLYYESFTGITSDGSHVIFRRSVGYGEGSCDGHAYQTAIELRSGLQRNYVARLSPQLVKLLGDPIELWQREECKALSAQLQIRPVREYDALLAKHPVAECLSTRLSPDKQLQAEARIVGVRAGGKWKGEAFSFGTGAKDGEPQPAWLELSLSRDGKPGAVTAIEIPSAIHHYWGHAQPCWPQAGKVMVWLLEIKSEWRREPLHHEIVLMPVAGPRIRIEASKGAGLERAANRIAAAIADLGLPILRTEAVEAPEEPLPEISSTRIEYRGPFEAEARAIAARLPGGAKLAPLKRALPYDVLIAPGPGLLKK